MRSSKPRSTSAKSRKVLLSIRPEFARKIISGEKRFEFRRRCFDPEVVRSVLLYATLPVGAIVGEFTVARVIRGRPAAVWRKTRAHAGISRRYFLQYFAGRDEAFAIEVARVTPFSRPMDPRSRGPFTAPQSYSFWSRP